MPHSNIMDDTLNKITTCRVADHGRHLIPAAQAGLLGITFVEKGMGASPSTAKAGCHQRDSSQTHQSGKRSTLMALSITPLTHPTPAPESAAGLTPSITGTRLTTVPGSTGKYSGRTKPSKTERSVAGSTNQWTAAFLDIKKIWDRMLRSSSPLQLLLVKPYIICESAY